MSHDFTSRDNEAIKSWKRQFRRSLCSMQAAALLSGPVGRAAAAATSLFPCPLPLSDVQPSSIAAARANIGNRSTPIGIAKKKERRRIPLGVRLHYLFFLDRQQRFSKAISLRRPQWQQKRKRNGERWRCTFSACTALIYQMRLPLGLNQTFYQSRWATDLFPILIILEKLQTAFSTSAPSFLQTTGYLKSVYAEIFLLFLSLECLSTKIVELVGVFRTQRISCMRCIQTDHSNIQWTINE